jgi:saccharopine dehydrogenase-like NADP-dependent oxidoreductase
MKVLILGGYGTFGRRLVELLRDQSDLTILIAGRSQTKAVKMVAEYNGTSHLIAAPMDRADIAIHLPNLNPDLVVDVSGPFQGYGDAPYVVPQACIAAGVHYIDLADGSDFVEGISTLYQSAMDANVFAISGCSTCPALTTAVLDEMVDDFEIQSIRAGIAPSPHAGLGLSVMRAVLGYAGKHIKIWRGGTFTTALGIAESMRYRIAPHGYLPLDNLQFSLVDVPDLRLLQTRFPTLQNIWFGAGPTPIIFHRALNLLSKVRGALRLPALTFMAPFFHWVLNTFGWGADRGGMFVHATGIKNNTPHIKSWHIVAEGDDGPFIPAIPASIIIQKMLIGTLPERGAYSAMGVVSLADYETAFAGLNITSGFRTPDPTTTYATILGPVIHRLPNTVQDLHSLTDNQTWTGTAQVRGGATFLSRTIARIIGFPKTGNDIPVNVTLTKQGDQELWQRNFNGQKFKSIQWAGQGRNANLLMERFGAITVALALEVRGAELHLTPVSWSILGIPLPKFLLPHGDTFETEHNGKFVFDVTIKAPILGLIVAYRGTLTKA